MAVRVALLVVVTGTFTAIWSGDHPEQMAMTDRPHKFLFGRSLLKQQKQFPTLEQRKRSVNGFASSDSRINSHDNGYSIPLPLGISAGTYLIVDQSGQTSVRIVAETVAIGQNRPEKKMVSDHYSVTEKNMRWHFIRIEVAPPNRLTAYSNSPETFR